MNVSQVFHRNNTSADKNKLKNNPFMTQNKN